MGVVAQKKNDMQRWLGILHSYYSPVNHHHQQLCNYYLRHQQPNSHHHHYLPTITLTNHDHHHNFQQHCHLQYHYCHYHFNYHSHLYYDHHHHHGHPHCSDHHHPCHHHPHRDHLHHVLSTTKVHVAVKKPYESSIQAPSKYNFYFLELYVFPLQEIPKSSNCLGTLKHTI